MTEAIEYPMNCGGVYETQTPNLGNANAEFYQMSYYPNYIIISYLFNRRSREL